VIQSEGDAERLCRSIEPWAVLATGVLITSCCTQNFSVLQLVRAPVRYAGTVAGGVATLDLPSWFPAQEAVLEVAGGALYAKLRELPLATRPQKTGAQAIRLEIDLGRTPLPPGPQAFSLTYFPWFRFLSEPLNFDAMGRVAAYVADCFRFLLVRNGIDASIEGEGDHRHVRTPGGFEIAIAGMRALRSVALSHGPLRSLFDLEAKRIEIDRGMFPAAYEAGQKLSGTSDRLANLDLAIDGERLHLAAAGGARV
jgi:hypothetical protein